MYVNRCCRCVWCIGIVAYDVCSWCWMIACCDLVGVFAVGGTGRELGGEPGWGMLGECLFIIIIINV
jgi:hypothetical protein